MDADRYLAHLRADADRLVAAATAAGLDTPVPSCPDWAVRDLVAHAGAVYAHKVACMRQGEAAEEAWQDPGPAETGDPIAFFRARLGELAGELEARGPEAPSYTWYPPDQTVGFWFRRMAQETAVHRVDAELAANDVTPIDPELAVDGVDELLVTFLGGPWWVKYPVPEATGSRVAVRTGGRAWRVVLRPDEVAVTGEDGPADVTVEGEPNDVLLWLWGRPAPAVRVEGDPTELHKRIAFTVD